MNLNDDAAGRLDRLEVKLGFRDCRAPTADRWDQQPRFLPVGAARLG